MKEGILLVFQHPNQIEETGKPVNNRGFKKLTINIQG
jgi:hypothetical protein